MRQLTHATCALLFSAMACTAPSAKTSEPGGDGDTPDIETHEDGPLSVRCESSEVADASLRRLTADEFQRSIEGIFPEIAETWGGVAMGVDAVGPSGFTTDARSLLVGPQSADEISRTAQDVATLVSAPSNIETILPCAGAADDSCAATFVDTYASKIYRKPLSDLDRSELLDYFDSVQRRSDFPTALKWTLVAMLQSPFFVYRSELGDETGKLSAHEVATALSYTFGGTPPDDALIAQAQSGDLEKQDIRVDVARRLMQTPGGRAVIKDFLKQWTGYEQVRGSTYREFRGSPRANGGRNRGLLGRSSLRRGRERAGTPPCLLHLLQRGAEGPLRFRQRWLFPRKGTAPRGSGGGPPGSRVAPCLASAPESFLSRISRTLCLRKAPLRQSSSRARHGARHRGIRACKHNSRTFRKRSQRGRLPELSSGFRALWVRLGVLRSGGTISK